VTTYRIEGYTRMRLTQECVGGVTITLTDSNSNVIETTSFDDEINCGWYQFTGLAAGTYTLTASKPCYGILPSSQSVTITNADATEKNFTARTQTYSIYGTVTELGGSPVAGAALSLYKNSLHIQSTISNSSGQYSFNGLANGGYTITIDSGCVPFFGNMSAFISCASVEMNFECQSGLCESKRQEAASRLNRLKTFDGIDNKGRQADNGDMDATADKDNPSASSHQPSARTEASVAEYLFYHSDHLGTVRLITDNSGAVVSRHDYEPFGVEIAPVVETANNTHRFTGHERDRATGYDYMHYRSYGSNIGRFMKPDNITGNPLNPQSWNLYSYVRGNPVNFNDPTGHQEKEGEKGKSTSSSSDSNMENPTTKANEKKEQEQPKKVVLILVGSGVDDCEDSKILATANQKADEAKDYNVKVAPANSETSANAAVESTYQKEGPIDQMQFVSHSGNGFVALSVKNDGQGNLIAEDPFDETTLNAQDIADLAAKGRVQESITLIGCKTDKLGSKLKELLPELEIYVTRDDVIFRSIDSKGEGFTCEMENVGCSR